MLTRPTFNRLVTLGLTGMAKAYDDQQRQPDITALAFEERFALLIDRVDNRLFILVGFLLTAASLWQMTGYSLYMGRGPSCSLVSPRVSGLIDSPLEGDGFEPSVPGATKREIARSFRSDRGPYRRREAPDPQHPQRGR